MTGSAHDSSSSSHTDEGARPDSPRGRAAEVAARPARTHSASPSREASPRAHKRERTPEPPDAETPTTGAQNLGVIAELARSGRSTCRRCRGGARDALTVSR